MKLYTFPGAPSPLRVELMLNYKGVDLPTENVDLRSGAQLGEGYRKINPRCTVPALVTEDGSCLSEVIAICLYLDEQYPDKPVFGTNALEKAQIVNRMHCIFTDGFMAAAEALRNASPQMKNRALPGPQDIPQIPALAERGVARLAGFIQSLDRALQGREFLVGEQLSQADIDAYVVVNFAGWVKVQVPEESTALQAFMDRVKALVEA